MRPNYRYVDDATDCDIIIDSTWKRRDTAVINVRQEDEMAAIWIPKSEARAAAQAILDAAGVTE